MSTDAEQGGNTRAAGAFKRDAKESLGGGCVNRGKTKKILLYCGAVRGVTFCRGNYARYQGVWGKGKAQKANKVWGEGFF